MTPEQEIALLNLIDRNTLLLQKLALIVQNLEREVDKMYRDLYK